MPRVSEEHLERRRRQILEAARACFVRKGIHETSMQDIFAEAGLSAGAVYRYFKSKNEIIEANVATVVGELHAFFDELGRSEPLLPVDQVMERLAARSSTCPARTARSGSPPGVGARPARSRDRHVRRRERRRPAPHLDGLHPPHGRGRPASGRHRHRGRRQDAVLAHARIPRPAPRPQGLLPRGAGARSAGAEPRQHVDSAGLTPCCPDLDAA
ncbi:TetR/AcrR family transcriptional regulator [Actinomadura madurae]|nr:TetR/AcrR family transcriptional regulator [Actinomadura madurae]MCQ0020046.1 TetR/AcrR family transcriptional regulator [Actinomadura madurae]